MTREQRRAYMAEYYQAHREEHRKAARESARRKREYLVAKEKTAESGSSRPEG